MRLSPAFLRSLRNEVSIDVLITSVLNIPFKHSEGHLRFLCPLCSSFHTATNPRINLARCFCCQTNLNPIDMVMAVNNCSFIGAVSFLKPLLLPKTSTLSGVSGIGLKIKEVRSGGVKPSHCEICRE